MIPSFKTGTATNSCSVAWSSLASESENNDQKKDAFSWKPPHALLAQLYRYNILYDNLKCTDKITIRDRGTPTIRVIEQNPVQFIAGIACSAVRWAEYCESTPMDIVYTHTFRHPPWSPSLVKAFRMLVAQSPMSLIYLPYLLLGVISLRVIRRGSWICGFTS